MHVEKNGLIHNKNQISCVISGGNTLDNQPFQLKWCWMSFSSATYVVNETESVIEITLQRRGFLGETSFISKYAVHSVIEMTAEKSLSAKYQIYLQQGSFLFQVENHP